MPKVATRKILYRPELVSALADELGIKKTEAGRTLDAFLGIITREVFQRGGRITLKNFGTFFLCSHTLQAKKTVRLAFKASSRTKRAVATKEKK